MHLRTILLIGAAALTLSACGKTAIHDTTEKANTHQQDLSEAKEAEAGSTETLKGKYKIEGTENTFYVVEDDKLSLVESGTYEFSDSGLTIQYGNNSPVTYQVEENEKGFNLTVKEDSISFGGLSYTWKSKDGKILFYDASDKKQKTPAITMVPVSE